MNEFSFTLPSGQIVVRGTCDGNGLVAQGGPQYPRLIVPVKLGFVPHAGIKEIWFQNLCAALSLASGIKFADASLLLLNRTYALHPFDWTIRLEVPLDTRRIEWLEDQRKDGMEFRLDLQLGYAASFGEQQQPAYQPKPFDIGVLHVTTHLQVAQSVWVKNVLPGLGRGVAFVSEIPWFEILNPSQWRIPSKPSKKLTHISNLAF